MQACVILGPWWGCWNKGPGASRAGIWPEAQTQGCIPHEPRALRFLQALGISRVPKGSCTVPMMQMVKVGSLRALGSQAAAAWPMPGRPGAHSICQRSGKRSQPPMQPTPLYPLPLPKGHLATWPHPSLSVPGHCFWAYQLKAYPSHSASSCPGPQVPHPGGRVSPACLLS